MKKTSFYLASLLLLATTPLYQGCIVAAVGAGIAAARYGSAKQKEAYAQYHTEMARINFEREKAGFAPIHIMTFEEWNDGKKASTQNPQVGTKP
jgi:hypothetical protein